MKTNTVNRMIVTVVSSAVLFVGMSMTTYAQNAHETPGKKQEPKEKKTQEQKADPKQKLDKPGAQQQDAKGQGRRLDPQHQQQLVEKQQQRLTQYRQQLDQQQRLHQQYMAQLQLEKRMALYRYQQRYSAELVQQRFRYENERNHDYQNDPFFYTAFDRRYNRGGIYYETNQYGVQYFQQAVQSGYSEGFQAGMADREDRSRSDYQGSYGYRDANYGYNAYYVSLDDYNYYFREGFRRGYEDGYNNRYRYGSRTNGGYAILGGVLAGIVTFELLR